MNYGEVYQWLVQSQRRLELLSQLRQPMTAQQCVRHVSLKRRVCTFIFHELSIYGVVSCLNESAVCSRLYWLTPLGKWCQARFQREQDKRPITHDCYDVDWQVYGLCCSKQRADVIKALAEPMQPATIKRRVLLNNPKTKMSANNARDVLRVLRTHGVVSRINVPGQRHPQYELTELGNKIRCLLIRAEVRE